MFDTESMQKEPLSGKTYRDFLGHLQQRNTKMFRHITKEGQDFQDAMLDYMSDYMFQTLMTIQNSSASGRARE